jgi:hypothetical protein
MSTNKNTELLHLSVKYLRTYLYENTLILKGIIFHRTEAVEIIYNLRYTIYSTLLDRYSVTPDQQ